MTALVVQLVSQLKLLNRSRNAEPARDALPESNLEKCTVKRLPQKGGR